MSRNDLAWNEAPSIVFAVVATIHPRAHARAISADCRVESRSLFAITAGVAMELFLVVFYGVMIVLTPLVVAVMAMMRLLNPRRWRAPPHPPTPPL